MSTFNIIIPSNSSETDGETRKQEGSSPRHLPSSPIEDSETHSETSSKGGQNERAGDIRGGTGGETESEDSLNPFQSWYYERGGQQKIKDKRALSKINQEQKERKYVTKLDIALEKYQKNKIKYKDFRRRKQKWKKRTKLSEQQKNEIQEAYQGMAVDYNKVKQENKQYKFLFKEPENDIGYYYSPKKQKIQEYSKPPQKSDFFF